MTTVRSEEGTIKRLDDDDQEKPGTGEKYWRMMYEHLKIDYDHLLKTNQNLEEKLLNVVELFDKKKDELMANVEYEKSTLMADVNKLSDKLVDARIKLHDYEEKEILHAAQCDSPCHRGAPIRNSSAEMPILTTISSGQQIQVNNSGSRNNNVNDDSLKTMPIVQRQMMEDPNLV